MPEEKPQPPSDTTAAAPATPAANADRELAKSVAESVSPIFPALYKWFKKEGKGMRDGVWGMLLIAAVTAVIGYRLGKPDEAADRHEKLVAQITTKNLEADNRSLKDRYTILEANIAPLLDRAVKEFPDKEIMTALKLIIEKVSKDPFDQPIASVSMTARIEVGNNKPSLQAKTIVGDGPMHAIIALVKGNQPLVYGKTNSFGTTKSQMHKWEVVCPVDNPYFRKPIRSLTDADHIEVVAPPSFLPTSTEVIGGQVTIVVNGTTMLQFDIPKQVVTDGPEGGLGNFLVISDLTNGMKPLTETP